MSELVSKQKWLQISFNYFFKYLDARITTHHTPNCSPISFYSPGPYPVDEEERQRVVKSLVASKPKFSELQSIVAEVAELFATPSAAVTILDDHRQWIPVRKGIPVSTTCRSHAFCGHTVLQADPLVVLDATQDERFEGNPLVLGGLNVRFYAGARLMVGGAAVGALCAMGPVPAAAIASSKVARLHDLAREASDYLNANLTAQSEGGWPTMLRVIDGEAINV